MNNRRTAALFRRDLRDERGNCFLYGCVTLVILSLLGSVVVFLALRYGMQQIRDRFTEETPIELPTVDMPQADIYALVIRVDAYAKELRSDNPLPPLTLSQDDLNALLQNHPDLKDRFGDIMYVTLGDSTVSTQMSFPLDRLPFPIPMMRNRYFNGTASFDVGFIASRAQVYLNSASVKGEDVPSEQIGEMRRTNFAEDWANDPDARSLMDKVDTIAVTTEGITITPKNKATAESPAPASETPPTPEAQPEAA